MAEIDVVMVGEDVPSEGEEPVNEEVDQVVEDEGHEEASAEPEREYSAIEKKAMDMGWKPQDEFSDDKDFISAEEYVGRQPLYDKIEELKKSHRSEMREFKKVIEGLSKQMRSAEKQGMEKVLTAINAKRLNAVEEGDVEAFMAADKEFNAKYDEFSQKEVNSESAYVDNEPELQEFIKRNREWFNFDTVQHSAMANDADQFYRNLVTFRQDLEVSDALDMTEQYIKDKYKDKFENPFRKQPSKVTASTPARAGVRKAASENNLTESQKKIYRSIKKDNPDYTVEQYLQIVNDGVVNLE